MCTILIFLVVALVTVPLLSAVDDCELPKDNFWEIWEGNLQEGVFHPMYICLRTTAQVLRNGEHEWFRNLADSGSPPRWSEIPSRYTSKWYWRGRRISLPKPCWIQTPFLASIQRRSCAQVNESKQLLGRTRPPLPQFQ